MATLAWRLAYFCASGSCSGLSVFLSSSLRALGAAVLDGMNQRMERRETAVPVAEDGRVALVAAAHLARALLT